MAFSPRPIPVFTLFMAITLLVGAFLVTGDEGNVVDGLTSYDVDMNVTVGETFQFTYDDPSPGIVLEAIYPGARNDYLMEPDEKSSSDCRFDLIAPYAGTNISVRVLRKSEIDGVKSHDILTEWIEIQVDGWIDEDGDGLSDVWEELHELETDDPNEDLDEDGIILLEEMYHLTDPAKQDSDGDSLDDGWEIAYGTIPFKDDTNQDPDMDGRSNIQEMVDETDPRDEKDHGEEPPATPWYWIVMIFGVLFLILGYFVKQLFSKKKLDDDMEDFDRNASRGPKGQ
jgi:hypothetical protein